jgi:hypothetical protein
MSDQFELLKETIDEMKQKYEKLHNIQTRPLRFKDNIILQFYNDINLQLNEDGTWKIYECEGG